MRASPHQIHPYILDIADKTAETSVTIGGTAAASAALNTEGAGGVYDIHSDIECFIAIAEDPTSVTTSNGYIMLAGEVLIVYVPTNYKIGVISSGAAGTLRIHQSRTF